MKKKQLHVNNELQYEIQSFVHGQRITCDNNE